MSMEQYDSKALLRSLLSASMDVGYYLCLGGEDPGLATNGANSLCTFDNITMYDPYIKRWFAQTASGTVPTPREEFCAVAQQGDNGTYEM